MKFVNYNIALCIPDKLRTKLVSLLVNWNIRFVLVSLLSLGLRLCLVFKSMLCTVILQWNLIRLFWQCSKYTWIPAVVSLKRRRKVEIWPLRTSVMTSCHCAELTQDAWENISDGHFSHSCIFCVQNHLFVHCSLHSEGFYISLYEERVREYILTVPNNTEHFERYTKVCGL